MKSQQYGHLNKANTMTVSVDLPVWMEELSQDPRSRWIAKDNLMTAKRGRISLLQAQSPTAL